MLPLALLIAQTAPAPQASQAPTLKFDGKEFLLAANGREERLALATPPKVDQVNASYRRNETSVYWDDQGLHIKSGPRLKTTRLPDIALTPKLFPRNEIIKNREAIAAGALSREASTLAGSLRVGDYAYFLPQWRNRENQVWLEALVRVSLSKPNPTAELVGRFDGLSLATRKIDDALYVAPGKLFLPTRRPDGTWGTANYNLESGKFSFESRGKNLAQFQRLGLTDLAVVEPTGYGRALVARIDLATGERVDVLETKDPVNLMATERPWLAIAPSHLGPTLRNLDTGASLLLPAKPVVRKTAFGILVYSEDAPGKAVLYSNERYLRLAVAQP